MDLEKLASSPRKNNSSEHLQLLAKRAVSKFLSKESTNLTGAVTESIRGEGLNKDQMRRVSEMANQAAWKETFSENRQVSFEPASHTDVINNFAERAEEVSAPRTDYLSDPPKEQPKIDLEREFNLGEGAPEYPALNPHQNAKIEHQKAASAADVSRFVVDRVERQLPQVAEDFFFQVKQAHLLEEHALTKIARAVAEVTDAAFAERAMLAVTEELTRQGVRPNIEKEKLAAAEDIYINSTHPLLESAVRFEKVAKAVVHARKRHLAATRKHNDTLNAIHR